MITHESNKQRWRKDGTVDYISIETRPPRKRQDGDNRCQITIDWVPAGDSGACAAFQELIGASIKNKTPEQCQTFYAALKKFAKGWPE